jgi:hypothetical protein
MQKDTLALFLSLIALTLSIFYFLSFHAFRNSKLIFYDENQLLFNKSNTYLCDNVRDFNTCKSMMANSNMLKIDSNDILLDRNTLICDNVQDVNSCQCLSKSCDFLKKTSNMMFIDKPLAFSKEKFGKVYGARVIPTGLKDEFSFSTWINISFINTDRWRSIFQWVKSDNDYYISPGIYISPEKWSSCNAKIDIRFSNMNENKEESIYSNGTYNLIEGNHGHCVVDTKHYEWFHFILICKGTSVKYYIDGQLANEEFLLKPIEIGEEDGYIYIGGSKDYSSEGIILAKTRWFAKALEQKEIDFISKEKYE